MSGNKKQKEPTGKHPPPPKDAVQFRDYAGNKKVWSFLGWKNKNPQGFSEEFFVRDELGRPFVIKPLLPVPPRGHWTAPPFPESDPCLIEPFRLISPPCRGTEVEARALVEFANSEECRGCDSFTERQGRFVEFARMQFGVTGPVQLPELWELIYGTALWPGPDDDGPLQTLLRENLTRWRKEHKAREREIDSITEADVQRQIYGENSAQRVTTEQVSKFIQDQKTALHHKFTLKWPGHLGGCLYTTLADVKLRNAAGIRDRYLRQQWADKHGFDRNTMGREKQEFLQWLKQRYDAPQVAALARVRFVLRFTTGERVYIEGIEQRDKLRERKRRGRLESRRTCHTFSPRHLRRASPRHTQHLWPLISSARTPRTARRLSDLTS